MRRFAYRVTTRALRFWLRVAEFCGLLWRVDDYYNHPAARWTIRDAWFVAGVVSKTCVAIRRGDGE